MSSTEKDSDIVLVEYIDSTGDKKFEYCLRSTLAGKFVFLEERGCHSIEIFSVISGKHDSLKSLEDAKVVELPETTWRKMDDDGLAAAGFTGVGELLSAYKHLSEKFNPPQAIFEEGEFVVLKDSPKMYPIKVHHSFLMAGEVFVVGKVADPVPAIVVYMESSLTSMP